MSLGLSRPRKPCPGVDTGIPGFILADAGLLSRLKRRKCVIVEAAMKKPSVEFSCRVEVVSIEQVCGRTRANARRVVRG